MTIFTQEFAAELDKPLAAERVGSMRGADYLEGHDVIRRANELFGYGNWGYEVIGQPYVIEEGASKGGTPYQVWVAAVRLTVRDGFSILEYGTNTRSGSGSDGLEMAFKGCITDGVKRCLKAFGDQFGLVLYHKQHDHLLERPGNASSDTGGRGGVPAPQFSHSRPPFVPKGRQPVTDAGDNAEDAVDARLRGMVLTPPPSLRDKLGVPLEWKTALNNGIAARKLTNAMVAEALKLSPKDFGEFYAQAYALCLEKKLGVDALLDEMGETNDA